MAKNKGKSKKFEVTSTPASGNKNKVFLLGRNNYILMVAGIVVILIGFALMAGGATDDKSIFPAEEIYSFRRISIAPVVVMLGFLIEVFAIMMKPKSTT